MCTRTLQRRKQWTGTCLITYLLFTNLSYDEKRSRVYLQQWWVQDVPWRSANPAGGAKNPPEVLTTNTPNLEVSIKNASGMHMAIPNWKCSGEMLNRFRPLTTLELIVKALWSVKKKLDVLRYLDQLSVGHDHCFLMFSSDICSFSQGRHMCHKCEYTLHVQIYYLQKRCSWNCF